MFYKIFLLIKHLSLIFQLFHKLLFWGNLQESESDALPLGDAPIYKILIILS